MITRVLVGAAVVIATWAAVSSGLRALRLRSRGFRVRGISRDLVAYEELRDGGLQRLVVDGTLLVDGSRVVYVPSEKTWTLEAPEWARERREEILARISTDIGRVEIEASDEARFVET